MNNNPSVAAHMQVISDAANHFSGCPPKHAIQLAIARQVKAARNSKLERIAPQRAH